MGFPVRILSLGQLALELGHSDFVTHNLHRHRQIERLIILMSGDVTMQVTAPQFIVVQTTVFTTKEDRHFFNGAVFTDPSSGQTSILNWPGDATFARTRTYHELLVRNGFIQR